MPVRSIGEICSDFWNNHLIEWICITGYIIGVVFLLCAIIGIFVAGGLFLDQRSCSSEAHGLGLEHRWGPLMGCLLKTQDGRYIPDTQYFINHPQP